MASVLLDSSDVALLSDPVASRVVLPRLSGMDDQQQAEVAHVQFEGYDDPSGFRGTSRTVDRRLMVRFMAREHETMGQLLDLFETARLAVDGRLLLRPNLFTVPGMNPLFVFLASDVAKTPADVQVWDVTWTARLVEFSEAAV